MGFAFVNQSLLCPVGPFHDLDTTGASFQILNRLVHFTLGSLQMEKSSNMRFEMIDKRIEQSERSISARFEDLEKNITARFEDLKQEVRAQRK